MTTKRRSSSIQFKTRPKEVRTASETRKSSKSNLNRIQKARMELFSKKAIQLRRKPKKNPQPRSRLLLHLTTPSSLKLPKELISSRCLLRLNRL
jgi:hypothetical protein